MWKVAKVGGIGELRATGLHALVAACAQNEGITARDRAYRSFEQGKHSDTVGHVMRDDLGQPPGIGPAGPFDCAKGEPAGGPRW